MISKLTINGFKGFKHIEIPKLSRVNLLGGRNNVGKTSILEALFMFHDRLNPQMILRQFAWRGVGSIVFDPESMYAPIFFDLNLDKEISIIAIVDGINEKMTLKFNPRYVQASIPVSAIKPGAISNKIRTDQKAEPTFSLDIIYYDDRDKKNQIGHLLTGIDGIGIHFDNAKIKIRQAVFLGARVPANPSEDAQKFGQLDIIGKQDKVVELLRIIEPKLKSLSSVAMGDTSLIHGDIGLSRKIPIPYMGDGVSRLLSIILAIATSKNGIVLIDEFENGIHYKVMPKIWEAVAKAAQDYNCQVIGTTHSYECLEAAYNGISGDLKKDFTYIRIDRSEDKTTANSFNHELLKLAIETNMEVR